MILIGGKLLDNDFLDYPVENGRVSCSRTIFLGASVDSHSNTLNVALCCSDVSHNHVRDGSVSIGLEQSGTIKADLNREDAQIFLLAGSYDRPTIQRMAGFSTIASLDLSDGQNSQEQLLAKLAKKQPRVEYAKLNAAKTVVEETTAQAAFAHTLGVAADFLGAMSTQEVAGFSRLPYKMAGDWVDIRTRVATIAPGRSVSQANPNFSQTTRVDIGRINVGSSVVIEPRAPRFSWEGPSS